jgi:hypothetical protein
MVERNGYKGKSHAVVTEDGHILTLFRVTSNQAGSNGKKQPIYMEHGILLDSDIWTFVGRRSLGKIPIVFKIFTEVVSSVQSCRRWIRRLVG